MYQGIKNKQGKPTDIYIREDELNCFHKRQDQPWFSWSKINSVVECLTYAMLKLRLIDLKAISSDSLALKKYFFPQIFTRLKATKSS